MDKEVARKLREKAFFAKQLGNIEVGSGGPLGAN